MSFAKQPLHTAFDTSPVQSSTVIANISPHHSIPPLFTPLLIPLRHSFISPRPLTSHHSPRNLTSLVTLYLPSSLISLHVPLFITPLPPLTTPHHVLYLSSPFSAHSHFTRHSLSPLFTPLLTCTPLRHSFISPYHSIYLSPPLPTTPHNFPHILTSLITSYLPSPRLP